MDFCYYPALPAGLLDDDLLTVLPEERSVAMIRCVASGVLQCNRASGTRASPAELPRPSGSQLM